MEKANQANLITKIIKFLVVFQMLKNGRPIFDISLYKEFFWVCKILNYHNTIEILQTILQLLRYMIYEIR